MLKRPSINDDDEEILRQQAEFFKQQAENKVKLAATLVNSYKKDTPSKTCISTDQHGTEQEKMEVDMEETTKNIQDQIANTFEAIPTDMKLNNITEKGGESKNIRALKFDSGGFPKAIRRDPDIAPKKGSIFSQHIKRLKQDLGEQFNYGNKQAISEISLVIKEKDVEGNIKIEHIKKLETAAQRSNILSHSDRELIHNQNLKTLNSMSEEEILAEREKLMSTLDPALVQFLRSQRSANKEQLLENRNRTIKEQNEAANTVNIEQLEVPKEVLSMPEASGWLNFNKFEANKLAWMKDVTVRDLKKTEGFEARFDFEGYLLPYSAGKIDDTNRHLYHHGDEPERPGYSLQELMLLSRSNIIQQRVTALNTLGNILGLEQTGIYDKVIDIPIEQVFFVLRVCLDDNRPSVLTASIKALRNLVYFQLDETCLDNMMSFGIGLVQPILAVDHALEDDNTVNDQQLAETNLVKCLARTNILVRIRYTINTIRPQLETLIYSIEILIRLARDSEFIVNKILQCEGLLSSLITYFIPPTKTMASDKASSGYNMPLPQMVKLLRVLSSRSRIIAVMLLKKHDLFNIMVSYLYEDYFSQNAFGMRLQVECMYYWTLLLHYGLVTETVSEHENLLLKFIDYHFKNTDNVTSTTLIRQCHVSALLILLGKIVEKGCQLFPNLMGLCFAKWISQFRNMGEFRCGHSQITSAMFCYAATCNEYGSSVYDVQLLESVLDSEGFNLATAHITKGSLLLNNYETHKTTANLKSLEAATWFSIDHIVPVMQTNSCIPLLYCLSCCILNDKSLKLKIKFLNHPNVKVYTEKMKTAKYYFNVGNWFTRCESFVVMNILKIARNVQDRIDSARYYDIAVKALCVFSAEQKQDIKYLLDNVVFCPRFYSVEVAMANTRLTERNDALDQAWKHLNDIKTVYSDVLGITSNLVTFETTLTLDMSIGNVIPVDWIYTPLVLLYSNQQKRSKDAIVDELEEYRVILNCLRWILIYETYFESLATSISPTEKYVRLGCLFLGSDSLFLHSDLQALLMLIFKFLVRNERKIDFEQEISGLTSFKDFFVQLLEQYQAVSYGNKVFGNILLFPLMKRHDVKYRKTLWSEYMGVVETFTVPRDEVWLNPEDLIYPVDTDVSLCNCYFKALTTSAVPKNTIMYEIAAVNVQHYKERMEKRANNPADVSMG